MLYESNGKLVILDLETIESEKTNIRVCSTANTTCIMPEGMMGLVGTDEEAFFVDEDGGRARDSSLAVGKPFFHCLIHIT